MSTTYVPTATSHGSYTLPSDGDPAVAESVNDALRDLADNSLVALNTAASALALASQAINGTTGGNYTPAADIQIFGPNGLVLDGANLVIEDGATLNVRSDGFLTVAGTSSFSGATAFSGGITVSATGSLIVNAGATFNNSLNVNGELTVAANATLGGDDGNTLTVEATSVFNGPTTFNSTKLFRQGSTEFREQVLFSRSVTLGDNATDAIAIGGTVTLNTAMEFSGSGRVSYRTPTLLPDASASVDVVDGDVFVVRPGLTGTRAYTLSTTGAVGGDRMKFMTGDSTNLSNNVNINSNIAFESVTFAAGSTWSAEFIYLEDLADRSDGWYLYSFMEMP